MIYPEGEVEKQGGAITKPVGTGPFEFVEWKKDAFLRMKKFKDYVADSRPASGWPGRRSPIMETVDFIPIPDSSVRAAAIERGDVDIAIELNVEDVPRMKGKPGLVVAVKPGIAFDDLRFGFKKGPFTEPEAPPGGGLRHRQGGALQGEHGRPGQAGDRRIPGGDAVPRPGPRPGPLRQARTSSGRSSSCRRPATRGRRSSCTAHLVPDRIAQGAVVIQAQLQAAGMNVEVKTLESAALQEVWQQG